MIYGVGMKNYILYNNLSGNGASYEKWNWYPYVTVLCLEKIPFF